MPFERITTTDCVTLVALSTLLCCYLPLSFRLRVALLTILSVNIAILLYWFANPVRQVGFLPDDQCIVGGHRGAAIDVPENTLAAFEHALAQGIRLLELDLELTQDNVLVVLHDSLVDRTTDGHGDVRSMTFAVTQTLDAAAKFKTPPGAAAVPRPQRIPRVEQVLDLAIERRAQVIIDVKAFANDAFLPALLNLYRSRPALYDLAAVCSFYPHVVYSVKRADPRIVVGHTWRPGFFAYDDIARSIPRHPRALTTAALSLFDNFYEWFLHRWLWKFTGAELVLINRNTITSDYIKMWNDRGLSVLGWTINGPFEQAYYIRELNCSFLTDKLYHSLR